jgi:hypothetical protein
MKKTTMFVFTLTLLSAVLCAQEPKSIKWNGEGNRFVGPTQPVPDSVQLIFSNLGPSTNAFTNSGWTLSAPLSAFGFTQFVAMAFTPTANAHVHQVRVAAQYLQSGANQVNLSLYSDTGGAPGTLLAGPITVTNLPDFYTCCALAIATFSTGTAVTAGTQYWVVANSPSTGTGSDFEGAWAFVPPSTQLFGIDQGSGWTGYEATLEEPAGAVIGTIP